MIDLSCIVDVTTPTDFISCFSTLSGGLLWNMVYFAILAIIIGGWSLKWGPFAGMAYGGFFTTLIGIGMFAFGAINVVAVALSLTLTIIGVAVLALTNDR